MEGGIRRKSMAFYAKAADGQEIRIELVPGNERVGYRDLGYCVLKVSIGTQSVEAPMSPFMLERLSSTLLIPF